MTTPHLLIVEAPYYEDISKELAEGAIAALTEAGASFERISVPGALEIPGAIVLGIDSGRFDGYLALGCVIRGETSHYEIVAGESARALMALTLDGLAIGNGILTCENAEQAMVRARVSEKNKGADAANAALSMIALAGELAGDG